MARSTDERTRRGTRPVPDRYRLPLLGKPDPLFRKSLVSASLVGALVLVIVFLVPKIEPEEKTVEEIPERLARLIIEKPKPAPVPRTDVVSAEPEPEAEKPEPTPEPRSRRVDVEPKPDADAGTAGRARAEKEITETLARSTDKVEKALSNLTVALRTDDGGNAPRPTRRRRRVDTGRTTSEMERLDVAMRTTGERADLSGSAVGVDLLAIGDLASVDTGASGDGGRANGLGAGPGVYRGAGSLLAIVRKYAAGIQFCYENELKRDPGLEGKIITTITVAANGTVTDVTIAFDSVGSLGLQACVLAQIRSWKFPPIAEGTTSFRAPFVFTPPKG